MDFVSRAASSLIRGVKFIFIAFLNLFQYFPFKMVRDIEMVDESDDRYDYSKIDSLFYKYANLKEDKHLCGEGGRIGPNGTLKLLKDINVPAEHISALALAWKFGAEVQCEFSLKEFRQGFRKLGVTTIAQLKAKAAKFPDELKERDNLTSFYKFAFFYGRSASTRHLEIDTAIGYWKLILDRYFSSEKDNRLQMWYMFLQFNKIQAITQDTWNLFLPFLWDTDPTLKNYDFETGPWPVLIDDFVQYVQDFNQTQHKEA